MESWLHKKVAKTEGFNKKTLEIGAGTLNQLDYERCKIYDIVEPYETLFQNSANKNTYVIYIKMFWIYPPVKCMIELSQ